MPNLVQTEVFPRTDFGSFGWITTFLPAVTHPAWHSQTQSFRLPERSDQLPLWNQTWQRLDWIAKENIRLYEVYEFFAQWHSESMSFRKPERSDQLDLFGQTWQRLDWIAKIPEGLSEPLPNTDFRISRTRFNLNLTSQHVSVKFQQDTKDEALLLEDFGVGVAFFPKPWLNTTNLNLTSNHITLKFQHGTVDEQLYLKDVGLGVFIHGKR